jgi:hypothetical protein
MCKFQTELLAVLHHASGSAIDPDVARSCWHGIHCCPLRLRLLDVRECFVCSMLSNTQPSKRFVCCMLSNPQPSNQSICCMLSNPHPSKRHMNRLVLHGSFTAAFLLV